MHFYDACKKVIHLRYTNPSIEVYKQNSIFQIKSLVIIYSLSIIIPYFMIKFTIFEKQIDQICEFCSKIARKNTLLQSILHFLWWMITLVNVIVTQILWIHLMKGNKIIKDKDFLNDEGKWMLGRETQQVEKVGSR
jgi:hypothetical protein